ncbi:hypothetical protein BASA81_015753 [Batrachochytrium salamandrivorans]|nr:hypothetical protein BASA81_015753 [Batrachochytrium salamandrivorans]
MFKRVLSKYGAGSAHGATRQYTVAESRLIRLEEAANARPHDPVLQEKYIRELHRQGHADLARARQESGRFAYQQPPAPAAPHPYSSNNHNNGSVRLGSIFEGTGASATTSGGAVASSPAAPIYVQMVEPDLKSQTVRTIRSLVATLAVFGVIYYVLDFQTKRTFGDGGGGGGPPGAGGIRPPSLFGGGQRQHEVQPVDQAEKKTFNDVKGMGEVKAELEEVVAYLKNPSKFTRLGGKLPKGMLLTGAPGVGKTLLAKAVAGEAGVPFFYASGSEFEELYVGVGARRVRDLFAAARKRAPCIIFIDEIDAVGSTRQLKEQQSMKMTLNQLLVELDGFEHAQTGVIVLAATNFPETLDPALVRPGRFDRIISVDLPDIKGREEILEHYLQKVPRAKDVNVATLAKVTTGMSGAELSNLVNIACVSAASAGLNEVPQHSFEYALDRILMGNERLNQVVPPQVRRVTAFHEGGHALVALLTEGSMAVHKATIVPRGPSLGRVQQLPEEEETMQMTKKQMLATMDILMAGRAAEEIIFGAENVTSGASSDLVKATKLARSMVAQYGMLPGSPVGLEVVDFNASSQETRSLVDKEVRLLLDQSYVRTKNLIIKHRRELDLIADTLLEKETLTGGDLKKLIGI